MEKVLETLREKIVEKFQIGGAALDQFNSWFENHMLCDGERICLSAFTKALCVARQISDQKLSREILNEIWSEWNEQLRQEKICLVVPSSNTSLEERDQNVILIMDLRRSTEFD